MLGLKQLTDPVEHPLEIGVFLQHDYQIPIELRHENPEFEFIRQPEGSSSSLDTLENWTRNKDLIEYSSIYIAGYIPMVRELRKKLKTRTHYNTTIYAHGFWR
ncbi:hypothetical protein [Spirosoma arboris]|uniref:hypothetical protein n=1 Tax=Spirosoma arboris TaxID=2682092 RepID=UPI0018DC7456|nr:hypothetical protein [Spirosoma arboris]